MPCPTFSSWFIQPCVVQAPACIGLDIVHNSLGTRLRCNDHVNVIGAHVGGQQRPMLLLATLQQCVHHHPPTAAIHAIRRLVHLPQFGRYPSRTRFEQATAWQIVRAIDGTVSIAVQVAAVTCKCNQIDHGTSIG